MMPKTLLEIYIDVQKNGFPGLFRVRNTNTLYDYLICKPEKWDWDKNTIPMKFWALFLEFPYPYHSIFCDRSCYTLLSSKEEIDYLRVMGQELAPDFIITTYKISR